MTKTWLISDTHFGHYNTCAVFTKQDGTPLRPFSSVEEMDEIMIKNWNNIVWPEDRVYHLGDVVINRRFLNSVIPRLAGRKALIMGNHDLFDNNTYAKVFEKIHGVKQLNGLWLTHVPMHADSVDQPRVKMNIHGHLHANKIKHPKYYNVSVECIGFCPIHMDDIMEAVIE